MIRGRLVISRCADAIQQFVRVQIRQLAFVILAKNCGQFFRQVQITVELGGVSRCKRSFQNSIGHLRRQSPGSGVKHPGRGRGS